jgi:hypothetical protein
MKPLGGHERVALGDIARGDGGCSAECLAYFPVRGAGFGEDSIQ